MYGESMGLRRVLNGELLFGEIEECCGTFRDF